MKTVETREIMDLYKSYGVDNRNANIRTTLNRGNLNKKLNCDFSNIYGKSYTNSYSSNSLERSKPKKAL